MTVSTFDGAPERLMYLTDDRDLPLEEQRALVIFPGGNGDWYVQVAPAHGRTTEGVRLCTSGGASSSCPGLTVAIAQAYRAMKAAAANESSPPTHAELLEEVTAWRARFPSLAFDGLEISTAGVGDGESSGTGGA